MQDRSADRIDRRSSHDRRTTSARASTSRTLADVGAMKRMPADKPVQSAIARGHDSTRGGTAGGAGGTAWDGGGSVLDPAAGVAPPGGDGAGSSRGADGPSSRVIGVTRPTATETRLASWATNRCARRPSSVVTSSRTPPATGAIDKVAGTQSVVESRASSWRNSPSVRVHDAERPSATIKWTHGRSSEAAAGPRRIGRASAQATVNDARLAPLTTTRSSSLQHGRRNSKQHARPMEWVTALRSWGTWEE